MNPYGVLIYKCKRCGELNKSLHVPGVDMAIILIQKNKPLPWPGADVSREMPHPCKDGNIGISELIGGEYDKE